MQSPASFQNGVYMQEMRAIICHKTCPPWAQTKVSGGWGLAPSPQTKPPGTREPSTPLRRSPTTSDTWWKDPSSVGTKPHCDPGDRSSNHQQPSSEQCPSSHEPTWHHSKSSSSATHVWGDTAHPAAAGCQLPNRGIATTTGCAISPREVVSGAAVPGWSRRSPHMAVYMEVSRAAASHGWYHKLKRMDFEGHYKA